MKKLILLSLLLVISMTGAAQSNKYATIAAQEFKAKVVNKVFLDPRSYRLIKIQAEYTMTNEEAYNSVNNQKTAELEELQNDISLQIGYINRMKQAKATERTDGPEASVAWGDPEPELAEMRRKETILINEINSVRAKLRGTRANLNAPAGYVFLLNAYVNDQYGRKVIVQYGLPYIIGKGLMLDKVRKLN